MTQEINLHEVGLELLHSSKNGEFSARGVLPALFPYIHSASKRMSTRAISRWLQESQGIKLSAVSIAKALRNPEKYWEAFADQIEPVARSVGQASGVAMESFLFDEDVFRHAVEEKKDGLVLDATDEDLREALLEHEANLDFLRSHWWAVEESAREGCRRYFKETEERETEGEA
jgi:hypothetical protein